MKSNEVVGTLEELKIIEMNLQNILSQKQNIQLESNEIENALAELKDYKDEVYKMVSQIMIRTGKDEAISELNERKKIAEGKMSAIERQEEIFEKKAKEIREKISKTGN